MPFILIFDADNTLWDTNAVFRDAQVAMLRVLEEAGMLEDAPSKVEELRAVDRAFMRKIGNHEYDFLLLAEALTFYFTESIDSEDAMGRVMSSRQEEDGSASANQKVNPIAKRAAKAHVDALTHVPSLLPSVEEVLDRTSAAGEVEMYKLIFSEGDETRLNRILKAHGVTERGYFDEVVIASKSKQSFERVRDESLSLAGKQKGKVEVVMIGDSAERDIRYANEAGLTTVHIPSDFVGAQQSKNSLDQPDYRIESFADLPDVLGEIGIPVPVESGHRAGGHS